jgi:hypothetical protein
MVLLPARVSSEPSYSKTAQEEGAGFHLNSLLISMHQVRIHPETLDEYGHVFDRELVLDPS